MLLLTYGQPKSASTFLYQLAKRACQLKMDDLGAVQARFFGPEHEGSRDFWPGSLAPLKDMVGRLKETDHLALKTHSGLDPSIIPLIRQGKIVPFVSYRHIGDSALSAFDAGEKARREQNFSQDFYKIESHRQALNYIGSHVQRVTLPWIKFCDSGPGFVYSYEELTNSPETFLRDLASVLDMSRDRLAADEEIKEYVEGKRRIYNFNKGVSGRYAQVFSREDIDYMNEKYSDFTRFCEGKIGVEAL